MIVHVLERELERDVKLFATIRPESKYSNQQEKDDAGNAIAFNVTLAFDTDPHWPVKGGMGGNYTLWDVELWVQSGDQLDRIWMHSPKHLTVTFS